MAPLGSAPFVNVGNSHLSTFTHLPSGDYGCACATNAQLGGYKFKKTRSKRSQSKRYARGVKSCRTLKKGGFCGKKHKKTRGGRYRRKRRTHKGGYCYGKRRKRMRGGSMMALTPGEIGENITLSTSYADNNVPSSFGYSLGGNQNTMYGALANPPPHARYQRCPNP